MQSYTLSPVKRAATGAAEIALRQALFPETLIHARDFGVIEDGETDNSAALLAMRAHLRLNRARLHTVVFDGGHVAYMDNQWLKNIGPIRIYGNGTKLECKQVGGFDRETRTWDNSAFFFSEGDSRSFDQASPYRFQSATHHGRTLALIDENAAGDFSVGERIFIGGFDQQFMGFPPNLRYFEWATISGVDTEENEIEIRSPLVHSYDEDWPQLGDDAVGPPAIWKMNNAPGASSGFFYNPLIEINEVETVDSGLNDGYKNAHTLSADVLIYNNCILDGPVAPSMNRIFEARKCITRDLIEIDKIIDVCRLIDVECEGLLLYGSGCNRVEVTGGRYRRVDLAARIADIKGATIVSSETLHEYGAIVAGYGWPMHRLSVEQTTFVSHPELLHAINNLPMLPITADATDASGRIVLDDGGTARAVVQALDIGFAVHRASPAETAIVSRIGWDTENDRWLIHFEAEPFTGTIEAEETFSFNATQRVRYRQNRRLGATNVPALRFDRPEQVDTDDPTYSE